MASDYPEFMDTRTAEDFSGLRGLAKRRILGPDFGPRFIKTGTGKNSKVLYSRVSIQEWMQARTRKSTSEHSVLTSAMAGA